MALGAQLAKTRRMPLPEGSCGDDQHDLRCHEDLAASLDAEPRLTGRAAGVYRCFFIYQPIAGEPCNQSGNLHSITKLVFFTQESPFVLVPYKFFSGTLDTAQCLLHLQLSSPSSRLPTRTPSSSKTPESSATCWTSRSSTWRPATTSRYCLDPPRFLNLLFHS